MKKLILCLSLGLLLLPGCSDLQFAQQEATEAIQNISSEAIRIKTNAETTVTQVKEAYDSVNSALSATQDAVEAIHDATSEIKEIGENLETDPIVETETENDPSLSSED